MPLTTCKITVEVFVDRKLMQSRVWPACDVMRTSHTRAWATRRFRAFLKDMHECAIGKDKGILVEWTAEYGEAQGFQRIHGSLSGVNGRQMRARGIFED